MTKDINLSIKGLHDMTEECGDGSVSTKYSAQYVERGTHKFISYEEKLDDNHTVKSLIKYSASSLEITRKGEYTTRLVFEPGKKNASTYHTPFGEFLLDIETRSFSIDERASKIRIDISYSMDMNGSFLSDSNISICIEAKY